MSEMSTENLLFWIEVDEYQSIKAADYRAFIARKIYRKYIKEVRAPRLHTVWLRMWAHMGLYPALILVRTLLASQAGGNWRAA